MVELLNTLAGTPVPTILIVAGLLFLLLAIADKVHGELRVSASNRKYALGAGVLLLLGGLAIEILSSRMAPPASSAQATTDWRSWDFHPGARPGVNCRAYRTYGRAESDPWTDILCMDQSLAAADLALADAYRAYRDSRKPADIPAAKADQRDWVKRRNRACPAKWTDLATYAQVELIADCLREQTEARTAEYIAAMQAE